MTITYSGDFNCQAIGRCVGNRFNEAYTRIPCEVYGLRAAESSMIYIEEPYGHVMPSSKIDRAIDWLESRGISAKLVTRHDNMLLIGLRQDLRRNIPYSAAMVKTLISAICGNLNLDYKMELPPLIKLADGEKAFKISGPIEIGSTVKILSVSGINQSDVAPGVIGTIATVADVNRGVFWVNIRPASNYTYCRNNLELIPSPPLQNPNCGRIGEFYPESEVRILSVPDMPSSSVEPGIIGSITTISHIDAVTNAIYVHGPGSGHAYTQSNLEISGIGIAVSEQTLRVGDRVRVRYVPYMRDEDAIGIIGSEQTIRLISSCYFYLSIPGFQPNYYFSRHSLELVQPAPVPVPSIQATSNMIIGNWTISANTSSSITPTIDNNDEVAF